MNVHSGYVNCEAQSVGEHDMHITTLKIAEIWVALLIDEPSLYWRIMERYKDFVVNDNEASGGSVAARIAVRYLDIDTLPPVARKPDYRTIVGVDAAHGYAGGYFDLHELEGEVMMLATDTRMEGLAAFLEMIFSFLITQRGGMMLHAAAARLPEHQTNETGVICIFAGASGYGKSTISLCLNRRQIINDDIIAVIQRDDNFYAYGTPFWGSKTLGIALNTDGPVHTLFILAKGEELNFRPLSFIETVMGLGRTILRWGEKSEAFRPTSKALFQCACDLACRIPSFEIAINCKSIRASINQRRYVGRKLREFFNNRCLTQY